MIKVLNFTSQNVNHKIVEAIAKEVERTGDKLVDFKDTVILGKTHEKIAELMISHGVKITNVAETKDRDMIEFYRQKLMQPQVSNISEYIEVLKNRFKVGTVCILNRSVAKGVSLNDMLESIIMIEEYLEYGVRVRQYYQSKVQPKYFEMYGGPDSKSLYMLTEIRYVDLYNNEVMIEHPRNEHERYILDELFQLNKK